MRRGYLLGRGMQPSPKRLWAARLACLGAELQANILSSRSRPRLFQRGSLIRPAGLRTMRESSPSRWINNPTRPRLNSSCPAFPSVKKTRLERISRVTMLEGSNLLGMSESLLSSILHPLDLHVHPSPKRPKLHHGLYPEYSLSLLCPLLLALAISDFIPYTCHSLPHSLPFSTRLASSL
ncbi:hypothetical protein RSAG8_00558, partial [Rhizoctonia solani AG-8 WAC10335]